MDAVRVRGVGLHTGSPATVTLRPEEGPTHFLVGGTRIPATVDAVVDTRRCTVLGDASARVATVEHLLAALHLRGLWSGVSIEVDGPEIPALDGSASAWIAATESFVRAPVAARRIGRALSICDGPAAASAEPAEASRLEVSIDFDHPAIGAQTFAAPPASLMSVADARTFGFLSELDALRARGLAGGASLDNALVFDDARAINPSPRDAEPVRHKALDLLGDLYLAGAPVLATIRVHRGSHRLHVTLAAAIRRALLSV